MHRDGSMTRPPARIAAWSAAWLAVAVAAVALAVRECADCSAAGTVAFAAVAALVIAAGAWCTVVAGVYTWAFAVAFAASMGRAVTGKGSRGDYWTAAFVCTVLGSAGALLASWSLDSPIGLAEMGTAVVVGTLVMLYVWAIASSMVSVCKGTASPAEWRNAIAGTIIVVTVAVTAVWGWWYMTRP